ncbi:secretion protein [Ramlibacter sp. G-1-2-2]|uniref:Secretion protein n=1 Tax=Ramlibacter agri TaxID=2728837 RepID=A0A848GZ90_9BURK|nr:secretin N-terminal domain-containing protein [Ramlibacter agri]NML43477.1 secretion protein [Ramlibacter agri]
MSLRSHIPASLVRPPTGKFRLSRSLTYVLCAAAVGGCSTYQNMKGHAQLMSGDTTGAIESFGIAAKDSTDAGYRMDYLDRREDQVRKLVLQADAARAEGKLADAQALYQQALKMDAGNARARAALVALPQDLRSERQLVEGENYLSEGRLDLARERALVVLEVNPNNRRAMRLKEAVIDAQAQADAEAAKARAARAILQKPVTLQFNNAPLRTVLEALSRSVGVNILLDRDVKPTAQVSIFVKDIALADAIDFLLLQNQLERRVVNANTLMIYPATEAKKGEYEDLSIRSFQITNADIKYLSGMLKTMLKVKEISADERTGILVLRDTPEKLRLAERLIAAHDVADPEIMLEVQILEVSFARDSNIGIVPPNSVTITTPGGSALTWGQLSAMRKDDLLVTPLSATINLKLQDSDTKILASPRIRARNKEKAKILIGDRVPTITNTVTPIATGASVVTGSVTYQDVGLKLEFEPQVYSNDEVGIKIALEVSNIAAEFTDSNGGRSYQIGTRNANTNLRLRDGETQILGGLITDDDRNVASKIPGLGHLPVIGRIFGNNAGTSSQSEIVLAITPHIVRNLAARSADVSNIFSGTYNVPRERPILAEPLTIIRGGGAGIIAGAPGAAGTTGTTAAAFTQPAAAAPSDAIGATAPLPVQVIPPPAQALPTPPAMYVRPAPSK